MAKMWETSSWDSACELSSYQWGKQVESSRVRSDMCQSLTPWARLTLDFQIALQIYLKQLDHFNIDNNIKNSYYFLIIIHI